MEEDSIDDGALKDYFEKGRKKKERKKKKDRMRADRDKANEKEEDTSGKQGEENKEGNQAQRDPSKLTNLNPSKEGVRKTTRLVSQSIVWMTQEQIQNQVVTLPFPQPSRNAIIRSIWTMKMTTS